MSNIITIAKSNDYDYFMAFYDFFYFDYLPNHKNKIYQNIITRNLYNTGKALFQAHGIMLIQENFSSIEETYQKIISLIKENIPIMIFSDICV